MKKSAGIVGGWLLVGIVVASCGPRAAPRAAEPSSGGEVATVSRVTAARRRGTVRIATWNIENFSPRKIENEDVLDAIVRTVRRYDIVAVEEVSDAGNRLPEPFTEALNAGNGADYDFVVSDRTGVQPDDQNGQEQYGFWWNTNTIAVLDGGELFPDDEDDLFAREPYAAQFRTVEGDFSFVLIAIHTKPTEAVAEIDALHHAVEWAEARWADEENFIVLGDFNAGCRYARPDQLDQLGIRGDGYTWIVPDDAPTSIAGCAHDRIVITDGATEHFTGRWGVQDDAFVPADLDVSDHWPVWATFRTTTREE